MKSLLQLLPRICTQGADNTPLTEQGRERGDEIQKVVTSRAAAASYPGARNAGGVNVDHFLAWEGRLMEFSSDSDLERTL